ncbi:FAD:protein FMN transferase [Patescibacteria group bacterium]
MNTKVEFTTWTEMARDKVHEIFDQGFKQFHFVIEKFSRFDPSSGLSILNNSRGKEVKVSKELFKLVEFAIDLANKTNGTFDPTIIDFLEAYGYDTKYSFDKLQSKKLIQKEIKQILKKRKSYKDILLYPARSSIKLSKNQKIDLGSIGKGYAIDKAFSKLKPLKNFIINAGGDIRATGVNKDGKPWPVGLKVPKVGEIKRIRLDNKAICCSGSWARKVKFFHHLINPKTGKPQNDIKAVFVIANNAMKADSWSTALFVMGKTAKEFAKKSTFVEVADLRPLQDIFLYKVCN